MALSRPLAGFNGAYFYGKEPEGRGGKGMEKKDSKEGCLGKRMKEV